MVGANGGAPQRLTDDPSNDYIPSWSQNGNWIYFSSGRTNRQEIWKAPSGGGPAVQITQNGGFVAFESPDGFLYYTKGENTKLWRSAPDGSGETEVLESSVTGRSWSRPIGFITCDLTLTVEDLKPVAEARSGLYTALHAETAG